MLSFCLALALIDFPPRVARPVAPDSQPSGAYSKAAASVWDRLFDSARSVAIASPDRLSTVRARTVARVDPNDDQHVVLDLSGETGSLHVDIGPGVGSEILWAPDSKALFVTTSDGGRNGLYRVLVIGEFQGRLEARDLTGIVYKAFGHPVKCDVPEPPNVGGIAWVGQAHHVLIAAEIVNHSICDSSGTFKGYDVDPASMQIVQRYGQLEVKRRFGAQLGFELADANDECV